MNNNKNKGGRPRTGRENAVTIRLSDAALAKLKQQSNKTAFIDALIRGTVTQIECPHCHEVITIKTDHEYHE